jgi:hypothetical protein
MDWLRGMDLNHRPLGYETNLGDDGRGLVRQFRAFGVIVSRANPRHAVLRRAHFRAQRDRELHRSR